MTYDRREPNSRISGFLRMRITELAKDRTGLADYRITVLLDYRITVFAGFFFQNTGLPYYRITKGRITAFPDFLQFVAGTLR
jgi:hypothetical protein